MSEVFRRRDYNRIVDSLDMAFEVFYNTCESRDAAEKAMRSFIEEHYFKVWRPMNTPVSTDKRA